MKSSFLGFYRPSEEQFAALWEKCVFIIDANVLLNLYRYPKEARDDLLGILKQVSDRLWIPHQAALEYQQNRLKVIADQVAKYQEVKKIIIDIRNKLNADLGQLQLKKRHSSIDPDKLLGKVRPILDEFEKELSILEKDQPDVFDDDELRTEIDSLFENKVGAAPNNQAELDATYEDGKTRYVQRRPPGYMDLEKDDADEENTYLYGGLVFKREYGDLILWKEILRQARESERFKNIIFVTDDEKEDWWWKVRSRGEKTIGPRPELVEEIMSEASVQLFYIYNSERFMEFSKSFLGAAVKQESIDQVREIARVSERTIEHFDYVRKSRQAVQAVIEWLQSTYPLISIIENVRGFPDLVVHTGSAGNQIGYEVQYVHHLHAIRYRLRDTLYRAYYEINIGKLEELKIVFAIDDDADMDRVSSIISRSGIEVPDKVSILLGVLTESKEDGSCSFSPRSSNVGS